MSAEGKTVGSLRFIGSIGFIGWNGSIGSWGELGNGVTDSNLGPGKTRLGERPCSRQTAVLVERVRVRKVECKE